MEELLLLFASFAAVFALFASTVVGIVWLLAAFVRDCRRFFGALLNPPATPPLSRERLKAELQLLKRAGQ